MGRTDDTRRKGRRAALLAADGLLLAGVLLATSPWTSGAYTWVAQRALAGRLAAVGPDRGPHSTADSSTARAAARARSDAWDGWEREDARAWAKAADGDPLGRLRIPRLGLDAVLVKGAHAAELRRGPGWVVGTSVPGPTGNVGVSGHRTTYLAPFRRIDELSPGDVIRIETRWRVYTYRVTHRWFAERDDVDWLFPTREPTLTLTSCHPPYSDRFRIVVTARLASAARR